MTALPRQENLVFDVRGHAILLEDHNEVNTWISHNLVILARRATPSVALLQSEFVDDSPARFPTPAGIWVGHPANDVVSNVVVASEGTGIWFSFVFGLCCAPASSGGVCEQRPSRQRATCEASGSIFHEPNREPSGRVDSNVVAGCAVGMNWDGAPVGALANNANNPSDRHMSTSHYRPRRLTPSGDEELVVPTFRNNSIYKSSNRASYFRGEQAIYEGQVYADNAAGPLNAYNQVIRHSLLVGWSANAQDFSFCQDTSVDIRARCVDTATKFRRNVGITLYDGQLVLDRVHFAGFPTANRPISEPANPNSAQLPVMVGISGAAERFVNLATAVSWEDDVLPQRRYVLQGVSRAAAAGAQGQAATLYDDDGWVTGRAGATLAYDSPINADPTCSRTDSGSAALVCGSVASPYRVGVLQRFTAAVVDVEVVRVSGAGMPTSSDYRWRSLGQAGLGAGRHVQMIVGKGYSYHFTELDWRTQGSGYTNDLVYRRVRALEPTSSHQSGHASPAQASDGVHVMCAGATPSATYRP